MDNWAAVPAAAKRVWQTPNPDMNLFDQFDILTVLILVALAVIILSLLIRWYRYYSRHKGSDAVIVRTARPPRKQEDPYRGAPPDVARWQVAMHETARDLSAQLDSKMSALQALIADADRAAKRLEAAKRKSPEAEQDVNPP